MPLGISHSIIQHWARILEVKSALTGWKSRMVSHSMHKLLSRILVDYLNTQSSSPLAAGMY